MKILLIDNPYHESARNTGVLLTSQGLLHIAGSLEAAGHGVGLLDPTAEGLGPSEIVGRIKSYAPDIVGLTAPSYFLLEAFSLARLARLARPKTLIMMGGPHPTFLPEEVFDISPETDILVRGEGELSVVELIDRLSSGAGPDDLGDIAGVAARKSNGELAFGLGREVAPDLNALQPPAYHLADVEKNSVRMFAKERESIAVAISRGCNNRCNFCPEAGLWGSGRRGVGAARLIKDISVLARAGKKQIVFGDDDFLIDPEQALEAFKSLRRDFPGIKFFIQSCIRTIIRHAGYLPELAENGVVNLLIGVESAREDILKSYNKPQNPAEVVEAARLLHDAGIGVWASTIFGRPDEDLDDLACLEAFVREKLQADWAVFNHLTPIPGSPFFDEAVRNERLITRDYSRFTFTNSVLAHPRYSPEELERALERTGRNFWRKWGGIPRPWDKGDQGWIPEYVKRFFNPSYKPKADPMDGTVEKWREEFRRRFESLGGIHPAFVNRAAGASGAGEERKGGGDSAPERGIRSDRIDVLYIHPHGHLNDLVIPGGALSSMNALEAAKAGRYAFELSPGLVREARVIVSDLHWAVGLDGLKKLVHSAKNMNPEAKFILGGITASAWPERIFDAIPVDYIIQGDSEKAFPLLVSRILKKEPVSDMPNVWRRGGPKPRIERLSDVEFDNTDSVTADWFPSYERLADSGDSSLRPSRWIFASRGCSRRCETCYGSYAGIFGPGVLRRSPESLVRQVRRAAEAGAKSLRIYFGHIETSLLREYARALAASPHYFHDGVGLYLCAAPGREVLEALRFAFPNSAVTISTVWPSEFEFRPEEPGGRTEEEEAACVESAKAAGDGIRIEFWHCRKESAARIEKHLRGISEDKAKGVIGYVWNMPRPNERQSRGKPDIDREQWENVLEVSRRWHDFRWARLLSPPLVELFEVYGVLDELSADPTVMPPPVKSLDRYWELALKHWEKLNFPLLPGISFELLPYRNNSDISSISIRKERTSGIIRIIPAAYWEICDDRQAVRLVSKSDHRSPVLSAELPALPGDCAGWVLLPSLNGEKPEKAFFTSDVAALQNEQLAKGGRLTLRLIMGRARIAFEPVGSSERLRGELK